MDSTSCVLSFMFDCRDKMPKARACAHALFPLKAPPRPPHHAVAQISGNIIIKNGSPPGRKFVALSGLAIADVGDSLWSFVRPPSPQTPSKALKHVAQEVRKTRCQVSRCKSQCRPAIEKKLAVSLGFAPKKRLSPDPPKKTA